MPFRGMAGDGYRLLLRKCEVWIDKSHVSLFILISVKSRGPIKTKRHNKWLISFTSSKPCSSSPAICLHIWTSLSLRMKTWGGNKNVHHCRSVRLTLVFEDACSWPYVWIYRKSSSIGPFVQFQFGARNLVGLVSDFAMDRSEGVQSDDDSVQAISPESRGFRAPAPWLNWKEIPMKFSALGWIKRLMFSKFWFLLLRRLIWHRCFEMMLDATYNLRPREDPPLPQRLHLP